MPCFINLPLRWVYDRNIWTDWFLAGRIAPEFGLDAVSITLADSWHEKLAARFRDAGLPCSVHLPFMGVNPAVPDAGKARASLSALRRGAEIAKIYGAKHMVGHPYYLALNQEGEIDADWLAKSRAAWPELPQIAEAPLFLENTYETSPKALAALAEAVRDAAADGPGIGICFDLGHWHSFAQKHAPEELTPWLDAFGPHKLHLHLHDNDGSSDQHQGLGQGTVPFDALFASLASRGKPVTATLEPHDVGAFIASIRWLAEHADVAAALGWEPPHVEALPLDEIAAQIEKG